MSLSCEIDDDGDQGDGWFYFTPNDYTLLDTRRRRRCCSCRDPILVDAACLEFKRARRAQSDIEERIWNDNDIPLAPWWMCETCGDLYYNLVELGFCIRLSKGESMRKLVADYNTLYRSHP